MVASKIAKSSPARQTPSNVKSGAFPCRRRAINEAFFSFIAFQPSSARRVGPATSSSSVDVTEYTSLRGSFSSCRRGNRQVLNAVQGTSEWLTSEELGQNTIPDKTGWFDLKQPGTNCQQFTITYKFGGAAVADARRMVEVARIICHFQDEAPVIVMSAMGKTTNLLLKAAENCLSCKAYDVPSLPELLEIRRLHEEAMVQLEVDNNTRNRVMELLKDLEQLLVGICMLQEITNRAKDNLVSFGERMSTRIFSGYLRRCGMKSKQFDAWKCGFITNDSFTCAELDYEATLAGCRKALTLGEGEEMYVPIVTGFIARGEGTKAITTLGRGGSDLTATVIGAALNHREVQVWKDVDGVLTTDPRLVPSAVPVRELTYHEATELAFFGATVLHPRSMTPADYCPGMAVRVKNAYNLDAPGTIILKDRDLSSSLLTSLVLKENVTIIDIHSNNMLGQFGFMARVFDAFARHEISVDVVATSEVSISVTLDPSKYWTRELFENELEGLMQDIRPVGKVHVQRGVSIISLICNVRQSSAVLEKVFSCLKGLGINVHMISQGASKTNIALVLNSEEAPSAVKALHLEFYGETEGSGKYSDISK
uniref:aspartate kinase n=1 Tax=Tetraselmis sp. GSL018 TaxID=582737 RepID=A0A061SJ01_9CHLO